MTAAESSEQTNLSVGHSSVSNKTPVERKREELHAAVSAQITVASIIGIICLILLLSGRNWVAYYPGHEIKTTSIAIIAQFRDFISGAVGFLIGSPNYKTGIKK